MVVDTLKSINQNCEIELVHTNETYNFSVYTATSPDWKYILVFSEGLASSPQHVSDKFSKYERIELYFCLPDYWDIKSETWPIHWLNRLAEIPQKNETWFGPGDTIPAGNPPEEISHLFRANHFMLTDPIKLKTFFDQKEFLETGISFLGIVPILQEELEFKIKKSGTALKHNLEKNRYTEQVDLFRLSVCRKRFLKFL